MAEFEKKVVDHEDFLRIQRSQVALRRFTRLMTATINAATRDKAEQRSSA
jgi:hypothetical protein